MNKKKEKKKSKVKKNMQTAYENGPMEYTMSKGSTYTLYGGKMKIMTSYYLLQPTWAMLNHL